MTWSAFDRVSRHHDDTFAGGDNTSSKGIRDGSRHTVLACCHRPHQYTRHSPTQRQLLENRLPACHRYNPHPRPMTGDQSGRSTRYRRDD
jgi:hypothetical protein